MVGTNGIEEDLRDELESLEALGQLRELRARSLPHDFASNDYLGLARKVGRERTDLSLGSTGSRLLTGHTSLFELVEQEIASFHSSEAALLFNSGYDANLGLLSAISSRHDTLVLDERCHASMFDGARLSPSKSWTFRHNDLDDLAGKLSRANGRKIVGIESVYSMDGDLSPIESILNLAEKFEASVVVDEAHAVGIFGSDGSGFGTKYISHPSLLARIVTFGKALGAHGAAVLSSETVKKYLVNRARPLIFSTALAPHTLGVIRTSYQLLPGLEVERELLSKAIANFRMFAKETKLPFLESSTQIQGLLLPESKECLRLSKFMEEKGFDVRPIRAPAVERGKERLRITLHSYNTEDEIEMLLSNLVAGLASVGLAA